MVPALETSVPSWLWCLCYRVMYQGVWGLLMTGVKWGLLMTGVKWGLLMTGVKCMSWSASGVSLFLAGILHQSYTNFSRTASTLVPWAHSQVPLVQPFSVSDFLTFCLWLLHPNLRFPPLFLCFQWVGLGDTDHHLKPCTWSPLHWVSYEDCYPTPGEVFVFWGKQTFTLEEPSCQRKGNGCPE